jgi:[ribosomal protein S5]-alanine N-acetyltransferase
MPSRAPVPELPEIDPAMELSAGRYRLRPFSEGDAEEIWPSVSQPEFTRYMSWQAHRDLDETRAFLRGIVERAQAKRSLMWAVTEAGAIVGSMGLLEITFASRALRVDRAELGYWTAPAAQGRGVARAAAAAVVAWGFESLALHRITVACFAANPASRRVIEHLGFRFLARIEEESYRDGQWWDVLRYHLRAEEWQELQRSRRRDGGFELP